MGSLLKLASRGFGFSNSPPHTDGVAGAVALKLAIHLSKIRPPHLVERRASTSNGRAAPRARRRRNYFRPTLIGARLRAKIVARASRFPFGARCAHGRPA